MVDWAGWVAGLGPGLGRIALLSAPLAAEGGSGGGSTRLVPRNGPVILANCLPDINVAGNWKASPLLSTQPAAVPIRIQGPLIVNT